MREIYVSRAGDPFHAGDKALTRETPAQRGRVNRYDNVLAAIFNVNHDKIPQTFWWPSLMLAMLRYH